jgi:hypothetical protein
MIHFLGIPQRSLTVTVSGVNQPTFTITTEIDDVENHVPPILSREKINKNREIVNKTKFCGFCCHSRCEHMTSTTTIIANFLLHSCYCRDIHTFSWGFDVFSLISWNQLSSSARGERSKSQIGRGISEIMRVGGKANKVKIEAHLEWITTECGNASESHDWIVTDCDKFCIFAQINSIALKVDKKRTIFHNYITEQRVEQSKNASFLRQ